LQEGSGPPQLGLYAAGRAIPQLYCLHETKFVQWSRTSAPRLLSLFEEIVNIRAAGLVVVIVGLITFFLPLARVQSPLVGTQQISGWDTVKPRGEKGRDDLGLLDSLERIERDVLRQKSREVPLSIQQANSLIVSLPLAYAGLLAGGVLLFLRKPRGVQVSGAIGLLACAWSVISVAWLSSGVKELVAGAGASRGPLAGLLTKSVAERTSVSTEWGLYLLGASLAALLAISLVRRTR